MSFLPDLPGRSLAYMWNLVSLNFQVLGPTPIDCETMLAIFWEEGPFFHNIFQAGGGTAVGFGQTEPVEFWRIDANGKHSELARAHGYLVHDLPLRIPLPPYAPGGAPWARLSAPLDDYTSVRVACAMLRDLFERGIRDKRFMLYAYGSVGYKGGPQPAKLAKKGGREALIQGWLDCEAALKTAAPRHEADQVLAALRLAKHFPQSRDAEFRDVLFPQREVLEYTDE